MNAPAQRETLPRAAIVLLVLLTLFWGFNWPVMKFTLAEVPIWTFRTICLAGGALGLFAVAAATGARLGVPSGQWPRMLIVSFCNITGWNLCAAYGITYLPSGRAAIIAYTMPLWSVLLSVWVLREPLTRRRLAGVALGTLGMAVLIGSELGTLAAAPVGALLMLGAALSWSLGTVLMKRFPISMPTSSMTAWFMLLGGLPIFAGTALIDHDAWHWYSVQANFGIVYNVVVSFVFCYWAWFRIVDMAPASVASLSTLMVPVVGVFSGMAVLGEIPHWTDIVALLLVLAALATVVIEGRPAAKGGAG